MKPTLVAVAALLVACGGPAVSVRATTAPDANLAQYRTFAFFTPAYRQGKPESIADQELRRALTQDLQQKGITEVTPGSAPDFLVVYHTRVREVTNGTSTGYGSYEAWPDIRTYDQGTLVVDFIDPHGNKVFWRGIAKAAVMHPESPDPRKIDWAVSHLMRQYPSLVASVPQQAM
jgi:hypothetical protein